MTKPVPRPGIMEIAPYVGGESALKGVDRVIKLSSNEGALGPSPRAVEAYGRLAHDMHRYPDGGATRLRAALGVRFGLTPERIVCGAGSDELLQLLCRAYAGPGDEVLYSYHGFSIYPIAAQACGATPVAAPETDLTTDVDQLLAHVSEKTRIVFIANPNNPTGTYLPREAVARLRSALRPDILLVLDAAYAEFVGRNDYEAGTELVDASIADGSENVVMTRTFSKLFALGGLRLGWAYCPPAVADVLNRLRGPFNVSSPALAAGLAAVEDVAFQDLVRAHNDHWRPWLEEQLAALGLAVVPSVANFVLVRLGSPERARAADAFLRGKGIIVRAMKSYHLPDCLRITVGTGEELQATIAALREFLEAP